MKIKYLKPWIEALRSGKYKQTQRKLRAKNGAMCCLGVLCEINGLKREYEKNSKTYYYYYKDQSDDLTLNKKFREEVKLTMNQLKELVGRNDGSSMYINKKKINFKKHSFKEIADWLEENLT